MILIDPRSIPFFDIYNRILVRCFLKNPFLVRSDARKIGKEGKGRRRRNERKRKMKRKRKKKLTVLSNFSLVNFSL